MNDNNNKRKRLPEWLKRPLPTGGVFSDTSTTLEQFGLETICTNANCPNRGECWSRGTATVLILGSVCTRNCKFCSVASGVPKAPDSTEPARVADMAVAMKLKYLVITSVTRDDLPDGGAGHFRDVIDAVHQRDDRIRFELLVPDFRKSQAQSLEILSEAVPFVFGHNLETVPRLYPIARRGGDYDTSLKLLEEAKKLWPEIPTKSSIMLGLGETGAEIESLFGDLRAVNCDRVAIGQYLKPSKESLDVVDYIRPDKFDYWAKRAKDVGFRWVMSSPFTRSSYHADKE